MNMKGSHNAHIKTSQTLALLPQLLPPLQLLLLLLWLLLV